MKAPKHGTASMAKLAYNLEKALFTFRHQGFIKTAKKGQNKPDKDLPLP